VVTEDADVLERALGAGAAAGVDPSGFRDPEYLSVAADAGAAVVARPAPAGHADVSSVAHRLRDLAEQADVAGIPRARVLIDAGLDARPRDAADRLLRGHRCLTALGWPVSVGLALDDDPASSVAAVALGTALGARVLRVHDVRSARRAADVVAAILQAGSEAPA
jgi:dihydropteroate synthase